MQPLLHGKATCITFTEFVFVALGILFGPKRDEITGEWGKLHNEELSDLYSLPNTVRW